MAEEIREIETERRKATVRRVIITLGVIAIAIIGINTEANRLRDQATIHRQRAKSQ